MAQSVDGVPMFMKYFKRDQKTDINYLPGNRGN